MERKRKILLIVLIVTILNILLIVNILLALPPVKCMAEGRCTSGVPYGYCRAYGSQGFCHCNGNEDGCELYCYDGILPARHFYIWCDYGEECQCIQPG